MDFVIPSYDFGSLQANQSIPRYVILPEAINDPAIATSYLGSPVYDQLILKVPALNPGLITTDLIMQTILLEVNQERLIQKTSIQGRNGTVKEYISDGDYMISIRGAMVSPYSNHFPFSDITDLVRFCKIQDSIAIASKFLGYFGINSIVIEKYRIAEKMGSRNEVPFEIQAVSDYPIEFLLKTS